MAPMLSEMGFGTIDGTAIVSCDTEFKTNGKFYEVIDRASAETAYRNVFIQMLNNSATAEGLTKEQFEAMLGATIEEYAETMVEAAMEALPQTSINEYKFEGNALYVRSQDETEFKKYGYRFNGEDSLIITENGVDILYTRIG